MKRMTDMLRLSSSFSAYKTSYKPQQKIKTTVLRQNTSFIQQKSLAHDQLNTVQNNLTFNSSHSSIFIQPQIQTKEAKIVVLPSLMRKQASCYDLYKSQSTLRDIQVSQSIEGLDKSWYNFIKRLDEE